MTSPVEIGAAAMYGTETPDPHQLADIELALAAIHEHGWRVVRTSTCACEVADALHGPDDKRYPVGERIADEWSPGAGPQPTEGTTP